MDKFIKLDGTDTAIQYAINKICAGSKEVENINAKYEQNILTMEFNNGNTMQVAMLKFDDIKSSVIQNNVEITQIKDFIISMVREKLVDGTVTETTEKIKSDTKKTLDIYNAFNNIVNVLFKDEKE